MSTIENPGASTSGSAAQAASHQQGPAWASPVVAVAALWACSAMLAVFAPDMVTGSEHDHLPIAAMTVWPWTFIATAYVVMAARRPGTASLVWSVVAIWVSVLVAGVAAPAMVTGTDPTTIPMGAILAPIGGAVATGLVALHHAIRSGSDTIG